MHGTFTENIFLNLDSSKKTTDGYLLKGWVGSPLGKISDITTNTNESISVEFTDREDVLKIYPDFKTAEKLGFEFKLKNIEADLSVTIDGTQYEIGSLYPKIIEKSGFMPRTDKDIIVVDDFYADPDAVRKFAINNLEFNPSNYHKGQRANQRFILEGTKEKLEEIIGREIYNWNHDGYANGIFQFCTADQPIVFHIDSQMMAAMVYLTPDAPVSTGTAMYKSKTTGLRSFPDNTRNTKLYEDTFKGLSEGYNFYDSTQFEMVDTVGNVYNRLVIFNSSNIHAATEYFGDNIKNSRFFHMFFFDVK
jgi:hypothetical protein